MHSHLRDMLLTLRNENAAVTLVGCFILDTIRCRDVGRARLSLEQISDNIGLHWQTVRSAVVRLRRRGIIERLEGGSRKDATVYCLSGRVRQ